MKSYNLLLGLSVALSLANYASAGSTSSTIVQTLDTGTAIVTYDSSTGLLSATDVPITATVLSANQSADFSFSAYLDTTGAVEGSPFGFPIIQDSATNIQFSITNGGTNILSGSAASATLADIYDGFTLDAQNPTFNDGVSFTSDIFTAPMYTANSLQITFVDSDDGTGNPTQLDGAGNNFTSFTAELGTNAFIANVSTVPLPASALAGGMLLGGLGILRSARRRRT